MMMNKNLDLSLEEKSAQILISFRFGKKEISDYCIRKGWGGIHLSIWDFQDFTKSREMIEDFRKRSRIPPFITADTECGLGQAMREATEFTSLMGLGATNNSELIKAVAKATALEATAVGLSWSFAPVVDVNTEPFNPSTNIRSYGVNPEIVSTFSEIQIKTYQENGLIATAKHFPGQGNSRMNSHYLLEKIERTKEEMKDCELIPFKRAISQGVEAIMTNHAIYPAYDDKEPSTLSYKIITQLLKKKMRFNGIVITDCLEMASIKGHYSVEESITKAILAGCDVIITENDYEKSHFAVVNGVKKGIITEKMLDERIVRILDVKKKYGLFRPLKNVAFSLEKHQELARKVAQESVRLERDKKGIIPLHLEKEKRILLLQPEEIEKMDIGINFRENRLGDLLEDYHKDTIKKRVPLKINKSLRRELYILAKSAEAVIFDISFRLSSGQIGILTEAQIEFIKGLNQTNSNLIILSVNPFVISQIPFVDTVIFTYSNNEYVLESALQIIFGKRKVKQG